MQHYVEQIEKSSVALIAKPFYILAFIHNIRIDALSIRTLRKALN
jgi:hypothetical protein